MLIINLLGLLDFDGPAIFKQKRVAKGGSEFFYMYKFRTMYSRTPSDTPAHLLENHSSHFTYFGSFLRKTSIDELPQL